MLGTGCPYCDGIENRCVFPFTRIAEPDPASKVEGGRTPNTWFAGDENEPLMFFAGAGVRLAKSSGTSTSGTTE